MLDLTNHEAYAVFNALIHFDLDRDQVEGYLTTIYGEDISHIIIKESYEDYMEESKMTIQQTLKKVTAQDFPSELWATMPDGVNRTETQVVWTDMAQRITEYDGNADELRDYVSEMADSLVPVYTSDKWREFMDYQLWNSNDVEFQAEEIVRFDNDFSLHNIQEKLLNGMLFTIYSIAGYALIEWAEDQQDESEEE